MTRLTEAQKTLVELVVAGETLEKAHEQAYPKSVSWTKRARTNNASKLLSKKVVRVYYDQKKAEMDEIKAQEAKKKAIWSFEQATNALKFMLLSAFEDAKFAKKLRDEGKSSKLVMCANTALAITRAVDGLNRLFNIESDIALKAETDQICFIDDYEVDND